MKSLLVLVVLLSTSVAQAQVMCSTQAVNNPGDRIRGAMVLDTYDDTYYEGPGWYYQTSGGETLEWDPGTHFSNDNRYGYWWLTANSYNTVIEIIRIQNRSDCHLEIYEVQRIGGGRRFVVQPNHKDQMHQMGDAVERIMGIMALGAGKCPWSGCKETLTIIGFGGWWIGEQLKAVDPWDDNYGVPYEPVVPEPYELGVEWDYSGDGNQENTNYFLWRALRFVAYGTAANVSINRANSCWEIGNIDCFNWQTDRAQYFLRLLGETAYDSAYYLDDLGWAFYNYWNPELDGNGYLADVLFDMAEQMRQVYDVLYQINY